MTLWVSLHFHCRNIQIENYVVRAEELAGWNPSCCATTGKNDKTMLEPTCLSSSNLLKNRKCDLRGPTSEKGKITSACSLSILNQSSRRSIHRLAGTMGGYKHTGIKIKNIQSQSLVWDTKASGKSLTVSMLHKRCKAKMSKTC